MSSLDPISIICGPTAVGKTAYALEIAQKTGAEIISADSGQIYRGMDIGTAKPTPQEQKQVCFHLINILNPDEIFSAADFRERALHAIQDIQGRGKEALIVGGTGLYIKVLEEGIFEGPSRDLELRAQLELEIAKKGLPALYRELQKADPEAAKTIPPENRQRIIRAVEVYRLTGKPISLFWQEHQKAPSSFWCKKIGLTLPKEELNLRIEKRIDVMMEAGLVAEVRELLERWGPQAPGLKLIGYKEIVAYLERKISLKEAVSLIKQHSRQYAKRQKTWFQRDPHVEWIHRD